MQLTGNVMRRFMTVAGTTLVLGLPAAVASATNGHLIYGTITTEDGDKYTGVIRWDKNEASWIDLLDGYRERDDDPGDRRKRSTRDDVKVKLFGLNIVSVDGDDNWSFGSSESSIRFGHIRTLEVLDDSRARLELKSGQSFELEGSSTDLGTGTREIVIDDRDEGEMELAWDEIEQIDFSATPAGVASPFGDRLYGTLTTRRGQEFTGFVAWDVDEVFSTDVLDGEERDRSRKLRFDRIAAIERYSSGKAKVILKSGDEMVLGGTNDVGDDNRGILIGDPAMGQVQCGWDEFDRLEFKPVAANVTYDSFTGGKRLEGVVYTEDGDSYTGTIRWDDDEEYTWETLNGEYRDLQFDVEFAQIKEIRKGSSRSCDVILWDGRTLDLRGSNDVDSDNKGIFIKADGKGREIEVAWDEFERVEFKR